MMTATTRTPASHDNAKVMNRFALTSAWSSRCITTRRWSAASATPISTCGRGRRPQNFYTIGSMGLAVPIALGVALAQPARRVITLEGDGSLLMQLGCLATVAMLRPANLTIMVMDNGI